MAVVCSGLQWFAVVCFGKVGQTPKIENRKPVFISETIRDDLDRIVRLFGERGMSVSGLVENLARNFLETYKEDVEQWRKM
ncbi:hypothetical protein FACS189413_01100 [Bacteroidia bacterium]|nr:hypothetical protein FACS189413_01100 [Bacteroidia bacterium]